MLFPGIANPIPSNHISEEEQHPCSLDNARAGALDSSALQNTQRQRKK